MIVGHRIRQYLVITKHDYGGHYEVATHRKVDELHATKGWRRTGHTRNVQNVRRLPSIKARREASFTKFVPARRPGPVEQEPSWFDSISEKTRERALMRHSWYRRQKEREARAAATEAWRATS